MKANRTWAAKNNFLGLAKIDYTILLRSAQHKTWSNSDAISTSQYCGTSKLMSSAYLLSTLVEIARHEITRKETAAHENAGHENAGHEPDGPYESWGCSRCTRSPMLGVNERIKLFGREIIFEEFQPI